MMGRCALSGRKVFRLRKKTGLPILYATVRGGEGHAISLELEDGSIVILRKDNSLHRSNFVTGSRRRIK